MRVGSRQDRRQQGLLRGEGAIADGRQCAWGL